MAPPMCPHQLAISGRSNFILVVFKHFLCVFSLRMQVYLRAPLVVQHLSPSPPHG